MRQLKDKSYYVEKRVKEEEVLLKLAERTWNKPEAEAALWCLTNQNNIGRMIVLLDSDRVDAKLKLLEKITDQNVLCDIVLSCNDGVVRNRAFNKITDEELLTKILIDEKINDNTMILKIFNKLGDKTNDIEFLKKLIFSKKRYCVYYAVSHINDEKLLTEIVLTIEDVCDFELLLDKITHKELIKDFVLKLRSYELVKAVFDRYDVDSLYEYVITHSDYDCYIIRAIERIKNVDFLKSILPGKFSSDVIIAILTRLEMGDVNDNVLKDIVIKNYSEECKALAVLKISSKECLEEIYNTLPKEDWYIRAICLDILETEFN